MNTVFAEHVTSTAFFLSISKKQIKYLQHIYNYPFGTREHYEYAMSGVEGGAYSPNNFIASFRSLENKGMVVRIIDETDTTKQHRMGHWELTNAGKLTCELLHEAGLLQKIEAQQTKVA